MAKNQLTDEQLDALLAKGHISSDFYDSIKPAEDKDKALKSEAKKAEEDYRLAENKLSVQPLGPKDNDPFGLLTNRQAAPVNASDYPNLTQLAPAEKLYSAKPQAQPLSTDSRPGMMTGPNGQAVPGTVGTGTPDTSVNPLPKTALPTDQIAGGKPAAPAVPVTASPAASSTTPLRMPTPQGMANPYAGPANQEAYLTPGEVARKTQLVEENKLKGDIAGRSVELQSREDKQIADIAAAQAKQYQTLVDQQAATRAAENQLVQQHLDMLNTESKQLGEKKIDPTRAFSQLPTGNKILAGIGLLFGAGGTKKGGQNPVLEQINKSIDNDIRAQEFDIKNQGASIDQRKGLLQERLKQFGNMEMARAAAKKDYLDIVEMNVKSVMTGNQSEKTRLKGDEFLANLQEAKDKAMFDFSQINDQRSRQLAAQAAAQAAAAQAKLYEDMKARRDSLLKINEKRIEAGLAPLDPTQASGNKSYDYQPSNPEFGKKAGETGVTLPFDPYTGKTLSQPQQFQARTKEDAEEIKKGNAAVQRIVRNIDKMQQFRTEEKGGYIWDREKVGKAEALRADTLLAIKEAEKTGALDEGSVDVIGGMIPKDPSSYGSKPGAQLDQTREIVLSNSQARLQNRLTPASVSKLPASPEQLGAVKNEK